MDPEGGLPLDETGANGAGDNESLVQRILQTVLSQLKGAVGSLSCPSRGRTVGVDNRFYYDHDEGVWKIRGGETEAERAESEALRFHTSRGLSSTLAPRTTACDTTRGASGLEDLPPPPTGGPTVQPLYGGPPLPPSVTSSLAHPVYAPEASFIQGGAPEAAPPPMQRPQRPAPAQPQALTSPFAQPQALTSPFAQPQALTSPFGGLVPGAPAPSAGPLSSPFQMHQQPQQQHGLEG